MRGSTPVNPSRAFVEGNEHTKSTSKSTIPSSSFLLMGTFAVLFGAVALFYFLYPYFEGIYLERMDTVWGFPLSVLGITLLVIKVSFLGYLIALYSRYKALPSVSDEELPSCTVIVPAYNEGQLVYKTLISLVESDYPEHKLQIIAIDDGSKDDTWQWMQKAKLRLGERISIYQQPKNMGKRHALYRGFQQGTGDVFITVDSDSIVKKDTLRNMTSPFVIDEQCGAVAGNVKVLNGDKALIPKMLNISFAFSFEFVRSAQSQLGSVLCTPGALSAYRKTAVLACREAWIQQTFMGRVSTIGEDRAMTNMILKQGYTVLFQRNAYVLTDVPEKYSTLRKMFTRWERSNVRENIAMSKFAFGNFRKENKLGTRILLVNQWIKMTMAYPGVLLMLFFVFTYPLLFLCSTLTGILIFSSVQAIFYARQHSIKEALWAYPYSIFHAFTLFWITPYALATAGNGGWLTRDLSVQKANQQPEQTAIAIHTQTVTSQSAEVIKIGAEDEVILEGV